LVLRRADVSEQRDTRDESRDSGELSRKTRRVGCARRNLSVAPASNRAQPFLFLLCLRELQPRSDAGSLHILWQRAWCSAYSCPHRALLLRLFLQPSDECAQRSRCRRSLARCARRRGRKGKTCIDLGEALVTADVLAVRDDAVGERNVRRSDRELAHLEGRGA